MDLWRIAVRAIVAYVYLLVTTRAAGKRVVVQATPFDFVASLILGDLIDDALWAEVPIAQFATAVATLLMADALVKISSWRSLRLHRLFDGVPAIVMRNAVQDSEALRREQLSEADLEHLVRQHGIDRDQWNRIRLGVVEIDHHLSVLEQEWAKSAQKEDLDAVKEAMKKS
ncbi:MAG TPA: YetF domain-containing protein [Thermoanaerobaculia bacterium]|nr:YetF domain-containing protein [Thermoanaerobaculia bacterium]